MTQTDRDAENGRDREKEQRGVKRPIVPATVPEPAQEVTTLPTVTHTSYMTVTHTYLMTPQQNNNHGINTSLIRGYNKHTPQTGRKAKRTVVLTFFCLCVLCIINKSIFTS